MPDALVTLTKNGLAENSTQTIEPLIKRIDETPLLDREKAPLRRKQTRLEEEVRTEALSIAALAQTTPLPQTAFANGSTVAPGTNCADYIMAYR